MPVPRATKPACLVLRVPRGLKSPNVGRGAKWYGRHKETKAWEIDIWAAVMTRAGARSVLDVLTLDGRLNHASARKERRRVVVTRVVPSARNFLKDSENILFSLKPVNDALKRLGLIYDDSMKWLEQPMPTQEVGPAWETVIQIERLEA